MKRLKRHATRRGARKPEGAAMRLEIIFSRSHARGGSQAGRRTRPVPYLLTPRERGWLIAALAAFILVVLTGGFTDMITVLVSLFR